MGLADSEHDVSFACFADIVKIWASACYALRIQLLQKRVSLASCSSACPRRASGALTPAPVACNWSSPPQRAQQPRGLTDPAPLPPQPKKHTPTEELATAQGLGEEREERRSFSPLHRLGLLWSSCRRGGGGYPWVLNPPGWNPAKGHFLCLSCPSGASEREEEGEENTPQLWVLPRAFPAPHAAPLHLRSGQGPKHHRHGRTCSQQPSPRRMC